MRHPKVEYHRAAIGGPRFILSGFGRSCIFDETEARELYNQLREALRELAWTAEPSVWCSQCQAYGHNVNLHLAGAL